MLSFQSVHDALLIKVSESVDPQSVPGGKGWQQFVMLCSTPSQEARFLQASAGDTPTRHAFHGRADTSSICWGTTCVSQVFLCKDGALNPKRPIGSPVENWHSILRTGLFYPHLKS